MLGRRTALNITAVAAALVLRPPRSRLCYVGTHLLSVGRSVGWWKWEAGRLRRRHDLEGCIGIWLLESKLGEQKWAGWQNREGIFLKITIAKNLEQRDRESRVFEAQLREQNVLSLIGLESPFNIEKLAVQ